MLARRGALEPACKQIEPATVVFGLITGLKQRRRTTFGLGFEDLAAPV